MKCHHHHAHKHYDQATVVFLGFFVKQIPYAVIIIMLLVCSLPPYHHPFSPGV